MKLATLKNGMRDGQLVVVSRDLTCVLQYLTLPVHYSRRWITGTRWWTRCKMSISHLMNARLPRVCLMLNTVYRHYLEPIIGRMVPLTLTMLNWCAKRVAQKCPPVSGPIL